MQIETWGYLISTYKMVHLGLGEINVAEWLKGTWVIRINVNVTGYYCVFDFHLGD